METSAIGGAAGAVGIQDRGLGSLKSEDFFNILVTELQQQDPFEPTKTADMISQVSQIRDIELSGQLNESLSAFVENQRTSGAAEWLGKFIIAEQPLDDGSSTYVDGVVTSVRFAENGDAVLELDTGRAIAAEDVSLVTSLEQLERLGEDVVTQSAVEDATDKDVAKLAEAVAKARSDRQSENQGIDWFGWLTGR